MNGQHPPRPELFVANTQRMKQGFPWQNALHKRLAALLYAAEGRELDPEAVRACYELIRKSTGLFSSFRGNAAIIVAALLSLSDRREARLSDALSVYGMLKDAGFKASDFLAVAAFQIADHADAGSYASAVGRAKAFYGGMKKEHRFLTGRDDYLFAAMLGLSDIEVGTGLSRMEQLYAALKPEFLSGNSVQALTQVLVLAGQTAEAVGRLLALRDALREKGVRLDRGYGVSSLGVLSLLPAGIRETADEVSETCEFLRKQKGFGIWSIPKQELWIYSAALVGAGHTDEAQNGVLTATVSTSIANIVIAQQAAIAAAAAASSAAAASAASSG